MTRLPRALLAGLVLAACEADITPLDVSGPPARATILSGTAQTGAVGDLLPEALTVEVTDEAGRPAPAVQVTWLAKSGALDVVNDSTDDAGRSAAFWLLPEIPGVDTVAAVIEGVGTLVFSATVQPIPGTIVFRYLDAGSYHACGITTTEQLLCWGYNGDGQLGIGGTNPRLFPNSIPGDLRYRLVSGGQFHACGTTLAQVAFCWGNNQDGRLGSGGGAGGFSAIPVAVSTNATFQAIQAGRVHSCAVDLSQSIWCWGYNGEGELGRTTFAPGTTGAPDTVHTDLPIKSVTVGGVHTCAIALTGVGLCWGYNAAGQLGDGGTTTTGTPQTVSGGFAFLRDPIVIFPSPDPDFPLPVGPFMAAGHDHTCAISTAGTTLCWGLNQDGQLGDGTRTQRTAPVGVSDGFVALTARVRHTCGLTVAGSAFCWGDNTFGQLGDGSRSDRLAPVAVSGGLTFAYLKAGDLFTCGITSAGGAYCWGDNEYGQLGDGTTAASSVPVKVAFQP
jgi:alpha-tubulin suppressor-like RCC1 family protein